MRGPTYPGVDPSERARRMARYRAAMKKAASPQLDLDLDFECAAADEENARWQPGVRQLRIERKANG